MVFSSLEFLFWFLPFCLLVYYLVPARYENISIFIFSLLFYGFGCLDQPVYILLLLMSIAVNYLFGLWITKTGKRWTLVLGLAYNFGFLVLFKYADFFIGNINSVSKYLGNNFSLPYTNLILPIGISFYTFQAASYLIDVYWKDVPVEKSMLKLGTYIVMFPQLIAGPIVRFSDVRKQLTTRTHNVYTLIEGTKYFVVGLAFKVLLANRLSGLWSAVQGIGFDSVSVPLAWMGVIAYSLQIYFDFYGYSLMAIGMGKMLGFDFPENFRHPYMSKTMSEFWRRWHITLGTWFREYVYIPLGGNRKGGARTYWNLFCVWIFTGFWHGASWNFIIWGLFLYVIIALEKAVLYKVFDQSRIIGHIYMAILIPVSWLIFAVDNVRDLAVYAGRLIGLHGEYVYAGDYLKYFHQYGIFLVIGFLFVTDFPEKLLHKITNIWVQMIIYLALFSGSVYCIWKGMNDPFMYFRF